jgi:hypothetical protein
MKNQPLCFSCKFGLCVKQSERAVVLNSGAEPAEPKNEWEESIVKKEPAQSEITSEGFVSICMWPIMKKYGEQIIQFEEVKECNRYEKNSSQKKDLTSDDSAV